MPWWKSDEVGPVAALLIPLLPAGGSKSVLRGGIQSGSGANISQGDVPPWYPILPSTGPPWLLHQSSYAISSDLAQSARSSDVGLYGGGGGCSITGSGGLVYSSSVPWPGSG